MFRLDAFVMRLKSNDVPLVQGCANLCLISETAISSHYVDNGYNHELWPYPVDCPS